MNGITLERLIAVLDNRNKYEQLTVGGLHKILKEMLAEDVAAQKKYLDLTEEILSGARNKARDTQNDKKTQNP